MDLYFVILGKIVSVVFCVAVSVLILKAFFKVHKFCSNVYKAVEKAARD